jgi:hypothetical protein
MSTSSPSEFSIKDLLPGDLFVPWTTRAAETLFILTGPILQVDFNNNFYIYWSVSILNLKSQARGFYIANQDKMTMKGTVYRDGAVIWNYEVYLLTKDQPGILR